MERDAYLLRGDGTFAPLDGRLDLNELGPKGFHLLSTARRARGALRIPRTLCIPSSVVRLAIGWRPAHRARYDRWLAGVRRAVSSGRTVPKQIADAPALAEDVQRDVADYFRAHPLPIEAASIPGPYAVRSSGYEDFATNLNAGGNRSRLNVSPDALPEALGFVAASVFASSSVLQRLTRASTMDDRAARFPVGLDDLHFAILVQEIVGTPEQPAAHAPALQRRGAAPGVDRGHARRIGVRG